MKGVYFLTAGVLAVLMIWPTPSRPAETYESLGRLFLTPAQRAKLDLLRKAGDLGSLNVSDTPSSPRGLRIDGELRNSQGVGTVWINGQETSSRGDAPVGEVNVPGAGQKKLRAGETFDRATGQRSDIVPQGQSITSSGVSNTGTGK